MKKSSLLVLLFCASLCIPLKASWGSNGPKIPETEAVLGHIFRDSRGHFSEDTPENRAFVEAATESQAYKVAIDNYGNELYLRTMPSGLQAWAEVREGRITNGGRNFFPVQWIPDHSDKGGHFTMSKLTVYDSNDPRFRGALTINRLVNRNGFLNPLSPTHWGTRAVVKGVEGQYGKILGLLDPLQTKGAHELLLPLEILTEKEALQAKVEVN